jgi:hypothetical protein
VFEMLTFSPPFNSQENILNEKHKTIEREDISSSLKKLVYEMISLVYIIII